MASTGRGILLKVEVSRTYTLFIGVEVTNGGIFQVI